MTISRGNKKHSQKKKKKKRKEKEKKGHGKRKKKVLNEVLTENKDTLVLVQKIWKLRIIDW